ncbi:MAG TPA: hypothetical protein VF406_11805 [Thermodesulfobacteriota bacterium]
MPALLWLVARPPLAIGLVVALAALTFGGIQWSRAAVVTRQRDQARAELALAKADLARQTAAVQTWQAKAAAQASAAAEAQRAAAVARQRHELELRRLLEAEVPATCEGAVEWGAQQAGALAEGWR